MIYYKEYIVKMNIFIFAMNKISRIQVIIFLKKLELEIIQINYYFIFVLKN